MRFSATLALTALIGGTALLPAAARTLLVPQHYHTIGGALRSARAGDTVLVSPRPGGGVYAEAVVIATPGVTLQGCDNPVIDGATLSVTVNDPIFGPTTTAPDGIDIQAAHVTVSGFTVRNFGQSTLTTTAAINVGGTDPVSYANVSYGNVVISGNTLTNDYDGILISGYNGFFYGSPTYLTGYQVVGNTVTGSGDTAVSVTSGQALVAGNTLTGNGGDGLDIAGSGANVTGNEIAGNSVVGLNLSVLGYNPAAGSAAAPNPAPTVAALNDIRGNQAGGVSVNGTAALLGNVIAGNSGQGVYLSGADYSTITGNQITGTLAAGPGGGVGQGIFALYNSGGGMTVSGNQISGNAADGIEFQDISGSLISGNAVTGNKGVGIFLSAYTLYGGLAPNTVTQNVGQHNAVFDALDEASASPGITFMTSDGVPATGAGVPTRNVWTRNVFGTTDPVGLGR